MATAPIVHLMVVELSVEENDAVTECMRSLNIAPLKENSDTVLDGKDKKFIALRYSKPTTLPVPTTVLLIPTAITSNNPTIEKQALTLGTCIYLTKNASI
ncbi:hypothetical protein SBOR_6090 [Sclerotinia borealis F-4128]|uniref:Uncharacterized protein n=1 Tax=Sclerotinia borealis (strain F-4128) TaxID=1432307 RepID=W9CCJ9_SCLBF|nr:hypothetical protein SBOR_6090 [Sclerotinia borealis F-4128]